VRSKVPADLRNALLDGSDNEYDRRMTTAQLAIVVPALAVVAVAGINAWWQARVNQQTLDNQGKLTIQARVASTYEDMMEMVHWQMEVVDATKPFITKGSPPEPPPRPETERLRKVQARIGVHGSREVKTVLERWAMKNNEFFTDAWLLDAMQNDPTLSGDHKGAYGVTLSEQWQKVDASKKELHGLVRELEDATSSELRA
jgi:hypothetical protein